ncbi:MAG: helix-turn-helix domain-containing protein [Akkermansiaceae bacterium]
MFRSNDARVYGDKSTWFAVSSVENETRTLLRKAAFCHWLGLYQIQHVGVMTAYYPYEVRRVDPSGTYMMSVLEGYGEVLMDGGWQTLKAGEACLLAPYMFNAFRCVEGGAWKFVWVRYGEEKGVQPIADTSAPVRGMLDGRALECAVMGLRYEMASGKSDELAGVWADLIHRHVLGFARPVDLDPRLWRVWRHVDVNLGKSWTLAELAEIGIMSEEHLRRLCKKQLGRSPMQHLIYLRMLAARELLISSNLKVEVIAKKVGYANAFTFSNTFKKWLGVRPSKLRD